MHKAIPRWGISALIIAACTLAAGCERPDAELTERPAESAKAAPLNQTTSTIAATVKIPYDTIKAAVNGAAPRSYKGSGRQNVCFDILQEKEVRVPVGGTIGDIFGRIVNESYKLVRKTVNVRTCQDVDYQYAIKRTGPITVDPIPGGLRLTVPISADGGAGFNGEIAKWLSLTRKNFRGSVVGVADVAMSIGADWCPTVSVKPSFVWTEKAQLEIAHKFWLNVDNQAGDQINTLLNDEAAKIGAAVDCADIRASVTKAMAPQAIPLDPSPDHPLYFNIVPKGAGFSGVQFDADAVRMAASVSAVTEIANAPIPPAGDQGAPPLEKIESTANGVHLQLPLRLQYGDLSRLLTDALSKREFTEETKAGRVAVKISAVEVYPAGERLVLGLTFAAKMPGQFLDTKGKIYLVAKPEIDAKTQVVSVSGVAFTRDVDNKIWMTLSAIFKTQIQTEIERQARFDLKPSIALARGKLQEATAQLSQKPPHLQIAIKDDFVGLRQVALTRRSLEVLAAFDGTAQVEVPLAAASGR